MLKAIKRLGFVLAAAIACVCVCAFASACDNEGGDDATVYTLIVKDEQGNALSGSAIGNDGSTAQFQLCVVEADGSLGLCLNPVNIGADGKAVIDKGFEANTTYEVHILKVDTARYTCEGGTSDNAQHKITVKKVTKPCEITVTLKAVN